MKIYLKSFLRLCYKAFVSVDTIIISFFNETTQNYVIINFTSHECKYFPTTFTSIFSVKVAEAQVNDSECSFLQCQDTSTWFELFKDVHVKTLYLCIYDLPPHFFNCPFSLFLKKLMQAVNWFWNDHFNEEQLDY